MIRFDGGELALTDGRTAARRAFEDMHVNLSLFDLCLDFGASKAVAMTAAAGCPDAVHHRAQGLMQAAGFTVYEVADTPALVVMRIVSMIVNEAAEAVLTGVADAAGVDTAMLSGVNYPRGPLSLADEIGAETVLTVLNHLQQAYGLDRYRPSLELQQRVYTSRTFHGRS